MDKVVQEELKMLIDKFLEIEEKYGLYDKEIQGINYWLLIRIKIFTDYITTETYHLTPGTKLNRNILYKIKKFPQYYFNSFFSMLRTKKQKKDILLVCHPRRIINENGLYECIYTDRIARELKDYISIEEPFLDNHLKPVETSNLVYSDIIETRAYIGYNCKKFFFSQKYSSLKKEVLDEIQAPLMEISRAYNIEINIHKMMELCCYYIYKATCYERFYKYIINRFQPKIIVETVGYSLNAMSLNVVAHNAGRRVIELQHGHISSDHEAYHFSSDYKKKIAQLPDELYLFSDYYKRLVQMPGVKLVTVGFPYFEENVRKYQISKTQKVSKNILIISNYLVGKRLALLALKLAQEIKSRNLEWNIIFKLHPSEFGNWEKTYPELVDIENIDVAWDRKINIYHYLATSEFVIGLNSTATYEALGFGANVIIYDDNWAEYIVDEIKLVENGYAKLASCPEDVMNIIEFKNSNGREDYSKGSTFWPRDSNTTLIKCIRENLK